MTQDELIVMLSEAIDQNKEYKSWHVSTQHLMTFAKMIEEKERTWVGLTEVEIIGMTCDCEKITMNCMIDFANAIQDKLKELNNG